MGFWFISILVTFCDLRKKRSMAYPQEIKGIIVSLPKTSQDSDVSAGAGTVH